MKYDLRERTSIFGKNIITFAKSVSRNVITIPLISQLVRAGTSVGSNYCEADAAESRKDFEHKLGICKKEAGECKHWLQMIVHAEPKLKENSDNLLQESTELQLIFIAIIKKSRQSSN